MHWARNALAHVGAKHRAAVSAMLKTIFAQENKAAAVEQWGEVADALRARHPKLEKMMDASREDALACMDFPREHWPQMASINSFERLNREIERRSDVVGIFPNDVAAIRLTGALMLEASDEGTVTRRTMSLEAPARVVRDDPASLPTTAARPARASPKAGAPTPPGGALPGVRLRWVRRRGGCAAPGPRRARRARRRCCPRPGCRASGRA